MLNELAPYKGISYHYLLWMSSSSFSTTIIITVHSDNSIMYKGYLNRRYTWLTNINASWTTTQNVQELYEEGDTSWLKTSYREVTGEASSSIFHTFL